MKKIVMGMVLLASASVAFAQAKDATKKEVPATVKPPVPAAPEPIKPPPVATEMGVMKDFTKSWKCTGMNAAGEKVTPKLAIKKELDGHWYSLRLDTAKTKLMPAFTGQAYVGYDGMTKGYVVSGVDNMGGWIALKGSAADVTATSMTFAGDSAMGGQKTTAKFMFKVEAKKLTLSTEFGGKPAFTYDCK